MGGASTGFSREVQPQMDTDSHRWVGITSDEVELFYVIWLAVIAAGPALPYFQASRHWS